MGDTKGESFQSQTIMAHVLDNPVWNALTSGNKDLGEGSEQVKFFASDVSPLVGFEANTPEAFRLLQALIPSERVVGVVSPIPLDIPPQWEVERAMRVWQMVQEQPSTGVLAELPLIPLGPEHVPAMLALTQQTNPGPFFPNTIAFVHYQGIFAGEKLVAMTGQRLHPTPYAEISAVCTHPDYLGRGYAGQLIKH
jgi:ribosomal protein S18 acetylase RimI-like enzyme